MPEDVEPKSIEVGRDVGPGAAVGGKVKAKNIAGGDINIDDHSTHGHTTNISGSFIIALTVIIVAAALLLIWMVTGFSDERATESPATNPILAPTAIFSPAANSELLVILAPFAGESKDLAIFPERYIRDELQLGLNQLQQNGLETRLEQWPTPITSAREARAVGDAYKATLIIWGEFDDIQGIRTFIEIMPAVPQIDIQQSATLLPFSALKSNQAEISDSSKACLLEAMSQQAMSVSALLLGITQLINLQYEEAEPFLSQAIQQLSTSSSECQSTLPQAFYWRGYLYTLQEAYPAALTDLSQALELDPSFRQALAQRGGVQLAIGNLPAAQADFEAALALTAADDKSSRSALLGNLGLVLELGGQFAQAQDYYEQAWNMSQGLEDKTVEIISLGRFGNIALRQNQFAEAAEFYNQALALSRENQYPEGEALMLGNLGLVYYGQEAYDDAAQAFSEALRIDEEYQLKEDAARQYIRLGLLHLKRSPSDGQQARRAFNEALARFRAVGSLYGQAQAYIGLGLVENESGNISEVKAYWTEALTLLEMINSPDAEVVRLTIQQLDN
ncbi:MAG: tetratricopeptide repeat protein [Anaerolineaceae bacterium]|nr:tetratricopeptide repeat protein [Anaerolineaceae bacterium]